ncbi:MAG: quinate 5-dehydrogenase [Clostridiales bacterium]|nr:quinate 5-dehydrogenase [Clostridiales bacterium]
MKRVVSVSLGSDKRDHAVRTEIMGEEFSIERVGVNGDVEKAKKMIAELDGQVQAIGLGGTDLYLHSKNKLYTIRESKVLKDCAKITPVVDGSFLKETLENRLIYYVRDELGLQIKGKNALCMAAVSRYGMARALHDCGANLVCGDLIFALGLPIPIKSLSGLEKLAALVLPIIRILPMKMLYPTGKSQDKHSTKFSRFFDGMDYICGDYIYIKKNMPDNMEGKIVITNTVTKDDVEELRKRGTSMLITGTPELNGRSFGTNVMEGVIAALAGKGPDSMMPEEFTGWLESINFQPRVLRFNE